MEKLHFISGDPAEKFDLHNISDPLGENSRSKSREHSERFTGSKNSQKSQKIEETES